MVYHAGCWPALGRVAYQKIARTYFRPLWAVTGVQKTPGEGEAHIANLAVSLHLWVLPPIWVLVTAKLKLIGRIAKHGV